MPGITQYLRGLIDAIDRHPSALSDLARKSGLSHATLDRIRHQPVALGAGGFNPTFRTIRELEKFLGVDSHINVIARRAHIGQASENVKIRIGLATGLWLDEQIRRAHDYLEVLRAENGRLGLDLIDYDYIALQCPDCAIHLLTNKSPKDPIRILRWGEVKDYRGGRDFSGGTFDDFGDPDLSACVQKDNLVFASTDIPLLTIHGRAGEWKETGQWVDRRFLRYVAKVNAPGEQTSLISVRRLKGSNPDLELIDPLVDEYRFSKLLRNENAQAI